MMFVLGAADPEMVAIENVVRAAGHAVAYAMADGRRVHPGNAYAADGTMPPLPAGASVVLFECDGPAFAGAAVLARCDHHRPGDAGYGRPPAEFWQAASIGQLVHLLAELRVLPAELRVQQYSFVLLYNSVQDGVDENDVFDFEDGSFGYGCWEHADCNGRAFVLADGRVLCIPQSLLCIAAADHCLAAAYIGQCPGVDPDYLMRWRAASRAAFQRRPVEAVLADIQAASVELRTRAASAWNAVAERKYGCWLDLDTGRWVGGGEIDDAFGDLGHPFDAPVDFGDTTIPELPEASARTGIAYLATVTERDGRKKRVLGGATPKQVRAWLAGEGATLAGAYGDPERGFAGGYL